MSFIQETVPRSGRRATKFAPDNLQRIRELVSQGTPRARIAEILGVSVGSLQVTCSRLGISLRNRNAANETGVPRTSRAFVPHSHRQSEQVQGRGVKLEVTLRNGGRQSTTEIPISVHDLTKVVIEASVQGVGMLELISHAVKRALTEGHIPATLGDNPR
jgi:hypothetical protein